MKNKSIKLFLSVILIGVGLIYIGYLLAFNNYSKKEIKNVKEIKRSMAIYLQGEDGNYKFSKEIPKKEDGLMFDNKKSMCDGNTKVSWNYTDWRLVLKDIDRENLRCYLYFKETNAKEQILTNKNISERTDFSTTLTTDTTGTIYKAEDNDGETYYFAGAPTDNWVHFAGFYWRIIRVNGDGTIRLIYSGSDTTGPATTGTDTQIGTSAFNTSFNDNMYVGYMYTSGQVQGLNNSSTIKNVLDPWYKSNIADKNFGQYVDANVGFCGDRSVSTNLTSINNNGGIGITESYYGIALRMLNNSETWDKTQIPTFKCQNDLDLYTDFNSSKGNKSLDKPIGLITGDEILYAGALGGNINAQFYLFTENYYWTMSPFWYKSKTNAHVVAMYLDGMFGDHYVYTKLGIRPVINLRADTQFNPSSNGTINNPYELIPN